MTINMDINQTQTPDYSVLPSTAPLILANVTEVLKEAATGAAGGAVGGADAGAVGGADAGADAGAIAALIGGVVASLVLILVCVAIALMWNSSKQKGSYVTNETDNDEDYDDEESVGSDTALQTKEE